MKPLDYIRVVLIQPTHPGNIGATARAMANMGVSQLVLVDPMDFPSPVATARAAGADSILNNAVIVNNLDQALEDCRIVLGSTARTRSIQWPEYTPQQAAESVPKDNDTCIALLFGRESSGMTNQELERCHNLIRIPVEQSFSSLNLASAVTVILYEFRKVLSVNAVSQSSVAKKDRLASAQSMRHFYTHMEEFITEIEFSDGRSTKLMRKMTRLFNRIRMYDQEVKMMRGLFRAVQDKLSGKY